MDNRFILSPSFNEVVFENRHKDYGAYQIRSKYTRYALVAVAIAVSVFASASLSWSYYLNRDTHKRYHITEMDTNDIVPTIGNPDVPKPKIDPKVEPKTETAAMKGPKSDAITSNIDVTKDPVKSLASNLDAGKDPKGTDNGTGTGPQGPGDCKDCIPVDTMPPLPPKRVEWAQNPPTCDILDSYLTKNIRYPQMCRESGVEGIVYVEFIVDTKGGYHDVKVLKGAHPQLNAEALRVMQNMPQWTPASDEKGELVEFIMRKPIRFQLAK